MLKLCKWWSGHLYAYKWPLFCMYDFDIDYHSMMFAWLFCALWAQAKSYLCKRWTNWQFWLWNLKFDVMSDNLMHCFCCFFISMLWMMWEMSLATLLMYMCRWSLVRVQVATLSKLTCNWRFMFPMLCWVSPCMWHQWWACIWCAECIFGSFGHFVKNWCNVDEIKGQKCLICFKWVWVMCSTNWYTHMSLSVWWPLARVQVAIWAYAKFDATHVFPLLWYIPGAILVLVGLVLVSHARCFVCECVRARYWSLHVPWLVLLCFGYIQMFVL